MNQNRYSYNVTNRYKKHPREKNSFPKTAVTVNNYKSIPCISIYTQINKNQYIPLINDKLLFFQTFNLMVNLLFLIKKNIELKPESS